MLVQLRLIDQYDPAFAEPAVNHEQRDEGGAFSGGQKIQGKRALDPGDANHVLDTWYELEFTKRTDGAAAAIDEIGRPAMSGGVTSSQVSPPFVERTLLWVHARSGPVDVVGEPEEVLAWRLGRTTGPSLTRLDGSPPGDAPPW